MITGPLGCTAQNTNKVQHITVYHIGNAINPQYASELAEDRLTPMHKLWDLESIGILPNKTLTLDDVAHEAYVKSVKYEQGQYWVKLPFKVNQPKLPTNYGLAVSQLQHLLRVCTEDNPADLLSRGVSTNKLMKSALSGWLSPSIVQSRKIM